MNQKRNKKSKIVFELYVPIKKVRVCNATVMTKK